MKSEASPGSLVVTQGRGVAVKGVAVTMNGCELCRELELEGSAKPWNQPLFESPNFVAFPSLGALVEGWMLLVTKAHFVSLGALPPPLMGEFSEFKMLVSAALGRAYGELTAFEHGPSSPGRGVGCGVDHAHLHLVPLPFDLSVEVSPLLPNGVTWTAGGLEGCRAAHSQGRDYLYLEHPVGAPGQIATHGDFGSQLFRRAIAARLGTPSQFNWREYSQVPAVMATIERIRAIKSGPTTVLAA